MFRWAGYRFRYVLLEDRVKSEWCAAPSGDRIPGTTMNVGRKKRQARGMEAPRPRRIIMAASPGLCTRATVVPVDPSGSTAELGLGQGWAANLPVFAA